METLISISAIGVIASVLGLIIKKERPEMALLLAVSAALLILMAALEMFSGITDLLKSIADAAQLSPQLLTPVFKALGIGIAAKLASDVCKDAGQSAIAGGVELAGTAAGLCVAAPLMKVVFEMLKKLI